MTNPLYDESYRNKKNVIDGRIDCSMDEMEGLMDDLEAKGWEYVGGIVTNPAANQGYVKYGHYEDDTDDSFAKLIEPLERAYEESVIEAQNAHWQACERAGRSRAGENLAKEMGYTGQDAKVFLMGFTGVSAKVANPRKSGREAVFRAGREAWKSAKGQREYRMQAARKRKHMPFEMPAFPRLAGDVANGEMG